MSTEIYGKQLHTFLSQNWKNSPYSNNFSEGHRRALKNTFPTCGLLFEQWQASEIFESLLAGYIEHFPPQHWDINEFGDQFAGLLKAQEENPKAKPLPWILLAELAQLEYALTAVYYDIDATASAQLNLIAIGQLEHADFTSLLALVSKQHRYANLKPLLDSSSVHTCVEIVSSTEPLTAAQVTALPTDFVKSTATNANRQTQPKSHYHAF